MHSDVWPITMMVFMRGNGVLECWSVGVLEWGKSGDGGGLVAFVENHCVVPGAVALFALQAGYEAKEAVFELEGQGVEGVKICRGNLPGVAAGVQAGDGFAERAEGEVEEVQILPDGLSAIAFGDVAVNGVGGGNSLGRDAPQISGKGAKHAATRGIEVNGFLPNA